VDQLAARSPFRQPFQRIHDLEQRLDNTTERLTRAINQRVVQSSERIAALASRLESLSPLNVLTRGYSLTHKVSGELVRGAAEVEPGDLLVTRVANGEILSRVEDAEQLKFKKPSTNEENGAKTDPGV
jgi:exodeoxyribonuclease VII large subunit